MKDDWIVAVLRDLREFADLNGLPFLAESLEDAARLAEVELARRDGPGPRRHRAGTAAAPAAEGIAGLLGRLRGET